MMTTRKRLTRTFALVLTGGVLLQITGCAGFAGSLFASVAEQVLISFLLSLLTGGSA
jgi:hypothetical protein